MTKFRAIQRRLVSRGIFTILGAATVIGVQSSSAKADVLWNWSFGGVETGTFSTDGSFSDTFGQFTFTIDKSSFTVTNSIENVLEGPLISWNSKNPFVAGAQSDVQYRFDWDGSTFTGFEGVGLNKNLLFWSSELSEGKDWAYNFSPAGAGNLVAESNFAEGLFLNTRLAGVLNFTVISPEEEIASTPEPFLGLISMSVAAMGVAAMRKRKKA